MVPHHNPAADVLSDTWRSVVTRSDYEHGALLAKDRLGVGRRCIGDPPPPMSPAMAPSLPGLRHPPLIPRADGGAPARLEMNPPSHSVRVEVRRNPSPGAPAICTPPRIPSFQSCRISGFAALRRPRRGAHPIGLPVRGGRRSTFGSCQPVTRKWTTVHFAIRHLYRE